MLAIVGGEPKILTLKDTLKLYIDFQVEVITRRTKFELKKAQERAHILEGLKIALDNIDEVINILRSSKSIPEGKQRLTERFGLDDVQTQAIVQMPLGRLTGLERNKIEDELLALEATIAQLSAILADSAKLLHIVKEEAMDIRKKFADERRTEILSVSGEVDIEDLIPKEDCVLTMTILGYVKRQKPDVYKLQHRGGRGISGMTRSKEDIVSEMFITNTHDFVMFFTNLGRVYKVKAYEIPESSRISKGLNIANLIPIVSGERVTSIIRVPNFEENQYLVMLTKKGVIKRIRLLAFSSIRKGGLIAVDLDEGDELCWVRRTDGDNELIIATKKGKAIRYKEADVRCVGRTARGVKAVTLKPGDEVTGMMVVTPEHKVLTISETGFARISQTDDYRLQARGGQGTINYRTERHGNVASINQVSDDQDIIIISANGIIIRIEANSIRQCSRPSKGVKVMKLTEGNKVVAVVCVPHEEQEDNESEEDGEV
jgi:DNA gyrase subunit A